MVYGVKGSPRLLSLTSAADGLYLHHTGGVAKKVIAPACQAGDRGFNPRRFRNRVN